ncbi:unnamed protein product [Rotaria sp. Silwood2]|nr:unnamed protein product [Rotaria sp. Silwood2]
MNSRELSSFKQLIILHPLLKDEQRDRITIMISGKKFCVQNRQKNKLIQKKKFLHILDGFWLAFITLTTLGYGDIYPRSFEARIAAGLCALIGIIIFSERIMNQLPTYNNVNDGLASRRYSGFPLNSTLVSSYTPDTIRSIISHAAAGQPYSTAVWIRINRIGIQVSAQDPQIARTRIPVFIPIGLVHDIFMLPNINNVICIVYDELQSNMKGVLLYVVHPSDAQSLRDDFRIVKQASNNQQVPPAPYSSPFDSRFSQVGDIHPLGNNRMYTPTSPSKSPVSNELYRNTVNIRQSSPRRIIHIRENETNLTPTIHELSYTSTRGSFNNGEEDTHRRHKSQKRSQKSHSPTKRSSDSAVKRERKHRSRSPEKHARSKLRISSSNHEISSEAVQQQQQQQQQQWLFQQQQQWLLQQQQMATWQAAQQAPSVPIGIYNRYVPKTIPLPTGETLKTAIPSSNVNGAATNGAAMAYIEPQQTANIKDTHNLPSLSTGSHQRQPQNRSSTNAPSPAYVQSAHHHHGHHHHHRYHADDNTAGLSKPDSNIYGNVTQTSRSRPKYSASKDHNKTPDNDEDTKQYLKMLVDEMQAMKIEMNKIRQTALDVPKGRSDSLQGDLKEMRAHIDRIRSRMALTPKIPEN